MHKLCQHPYVNPIISIDSNEFSFSQVPLTCFSPTVFCTHPYQTVLVNIQVWEKAFLTCISRYSVLQCFPLCSWLSSLAISESIFFPEFCFANSMIVKSFIVVLNVSHSFLLQRGSGLPDFIPKYPGNAFLLFFCCCCCLYLFLHLVCFLFVF